jgi:hypothetical protein
MSLAPFEQQILTDIETRLRRSDPKLAARLALFRRHASRGQGPARELLSPGGPLPPTGRLDRAGYRADGGAADPKHRAGWPRWAVARRRYGICRITAADRAAQPTCSCVGRRYKQRAHAELGVTPAEAFTLLRQHSQDTNQRVRGRMCFKAVDRGEGRATQLDDSGEFLCSAPAAGRPRCAPGRRGLT